MKRQSWILLGMIALAVGIAGVWWSAGKTEQSLRPVTSTKNANASSRTDAITAALAQRQRAYLTLRRRNTAAVAAPALMYHYIRECTDPEDKGCPALSVSPAVFDTQMKWLHDHGYVSVGPDYFITPHRVAGKPILLSFDDGYQDVYDNALPILQKYGFTATMYIITGKVGLTGYVTWPEVIDLDRRGMTIGSHTINHLDLRKLSPADLTHEVVTSKQEIEQELGHPIYDFCYPYGFFNDQVVAAVKKAGYLVATTTEEYLVTKQSALLKIPRMRIRELTDMSVVVQGTKSEAWRNANTNMPANFNANRDPYQP